MMVVKLGLINLPSGNDQYFAKKTMAHKNIVDLPVKNGDFSSSQTFGLPGGIVYWRIMLPGCHGDVDSRS